MPLITRRQLAIRAGALFSTTAALNARASIEAEGQELISKPAPPLALKGLTQLEAS